MALKTVAVFCGSNRGDSPAYAKAATELGAALARAEIGIVFGGTNKGLMASLAAGAAQNRGRLHGVITQKLADQGQSCEYSEQLEVVASRGERKQRMTELADAFIALPGGIGTLEELFEVWVNAQFEGHTKPMGLLNTNEFFRHLLLFIGDMVDRAFLPPQQRKMIFVESDPAALILGLQNFVPVNVSKWL